MLEQVVRNRYQNITTGITHGAGIDYKSEIDLKKKSETLQAMPSGSAAQTRAPFS